MKRACVLFVALLCLAGCDEEPGTDAGTDAASPVDAGPMDAGPVDAGRDSGPADAGRDGGPPDDGGPGDGGPGDAGPEDGGPDDGGPGDGGPGDGGPMDGGPVDAGPVDGGPADGGPADGGPADGGPTDGGPDAGVDPDDPDGDGVLTGTEEACGTDPSDTLDFPTAGSLRGAGTDIDPYRICLPEHFALFAAASDVLTAHARMGDDIDMTGVSLGPAIGTSEAPFVGVFGGDGYVLDQLTVGTMEAPRAGLFGFVGDGGVVEGMVVRNAVSFQGAVLVDMNAGTMRRVAVSGTTNADTNVGLVANQNTASGVIEGCSSEGSVVAMRSHVGGLAGRNEGLIVESFSHATVSGDNRTGGLMGSGAGVVRACFATGDVSGARKWIGGLVGTARDGAVIENSFALGDVRASVGEAGGVVGNTEGTAIVRFVYAQNRVEGSVASGGVVGVDSSSGAASITACFFDSDLTASDATCVGRTGAQLAMEASYTGFDFVDVWRMDAGIRPTAVLFWE